MDEKLGRMVTRVVLPHVVMHSRYHYGVILTLHYASNCDGYLMRSMRILSVMYLCSMLKSLRSRRPENHKLFLLKKKKTTDY